MEQERKTRILTRVAGSDGDSSALAFESDTSTMRAGTRIGQYSVREQIGEGGFAAVYLAEQVEPFRRRVALKFIKPGMDTKEIIARFEAERQALALMDHPNVAKVFDAGTTEQGRPYFVMEYVQGIPITDYCDRHRLTTRDRLGLFVQACEGVQHAHQKGIIHRDVKPSNVLVAVTDGDSRVKVIDFGIAKAVNLTLTDKTVFTRQGQLIGTPEYMSPEQAEMDALDIDTRTDIYSLGVLLYELVTGVLPYDRVSLSREAAEIRRIIREEQPLRPSTRLSTVGVDAMRIATKHGSDPRSLERELRGDLDWITMRALDKDRTRRYAAASELAADVDRYFRNDPVTARAPSVVYRARKALKRHLLAMVALLSLLLASSVGLVSHLWRVESLNAEMAERLSAARAEVRREIACREELTSEHEAKTRRWAQTMAGYSAQLESAVAYLSDSIDEYIVVRGSDHPDTLVAMASLAELYVQIERFEEAEQLFTRQLEIQRFSLFGEQYAGWNPDQSRPLRPWKQHADMIATGQRLARLYERRGAFKDAEPLRLEAYWILEHAFGSTDERVTSAAAALAHLYRAWGRPEEAELWRLRSSRARDPEGTASAHPQRPDADDSPATQDPARRFRDPKPFTTSPEAGRAREPDSQNARFADDDRAQRWTVDERSLEITVTVEFPTPSKVGYILELASEGDAEASYQAYLVLLNGIGRRPDIRKAQQFLDVAAEAGEPNALFTRGAQYHVGHDYVPRSTAAAVRDYQRALSKEPRHLAARHNYAVMLVNGQGMPPDASKAADLLVDGILRGVPESALVASAMLMTEKGTEGLSAFERTSLAVACLGQAEKLDLVREYVGTLPRSGESWIDRMNATIESEGLELASRHGEEEAGFRRLLASLHVEGDPDVAAPRGPAHTYWLKPALRTLLLEHLGPECRMAVNPDLPDVPEHMFYRVRDASHRRLIEQRARYYVMAPDGTCYNNFRAVRIAELLAEREARKRNATRVLKIDLELEALGHHRVTDGDWKLEIVDETGAGLETDPGRPTPVTGDELMVYGIDTRPSPKVTRIDGDYVFVDLGGRESAIAGQLVGVREVVVGQQLDGVFQLHPTSRTTALPYSDPPVTVPVFAVQPLDGFVPAPDQLAWAIENGMANLYDPNLDTSISKPTYKRGRKIPSPAGLQKYEMVLDKPGKVTHRWRGAAKNVRFLPEPKLPRILQERVDAIPKESGGKL